MEVRLEEETPAVTDHQLALSALSRLPDRCAIDLGDLAARIGADKLELITWVRADIKFARLIASKVGK